MPVDAQARHELFTRVEEVLGARPAATLRELLPPMDWSQFATKADLRELEARLRECIAQATTSQNRTMIVTVVSLVIAMMGTMAAVVQEALA